MLMGSLPVMGARPSNARAAARWETGASLHARTYVPSSGRTESTYGSPKETNRIGRERASLSRLSAMCFGSPISPFQGSAWEEEETTTAPRARVAAAVRASVAAGGGGRAEG